MKSNRASRRRLYLSYGSYDFSNSGFVVMFQSFLFPMLFAEALHREGSKGGQAWGWAVAASSVIAILGAPIVGRIADASGKWRVFALLVFIAAAGATLVPISLAGRVVALGVAFILFNAAFELSQSVYDSFLLNIESGSEGLTSLSTFSWGFGYLGGALFAVVYFGLDKAGVSSPVMLAVFGALFGLLSVPSIVAFRRLAPTRQEFRTRPLRDLLRPKSPVPWADLLIYWIIADCVAAVMYFAPLFIQSEVGLSTRMVGGIILGAQLLAFPATVLVGQVAHRFGNMRVIRGTLVLWVVALGGLYFSTRLLHIVLVATILAFVMGSTQAILRAHFASRVSAEQSAEGLGFYAVAQKSASILSPLLVAGVALATGKLRPAFLALLVLASVAIVLSGRLDRSSRGPIVSAGS